MVTPWPYYGYKIVSKIFAELAGTLSDTSDDAMAGEALILTALFTFSRSPVSKRFRYHSRGRRLRH